MFWRKKASSKVAAESEPKWDHPIGDYGNNVYSFKASRHLCDARGKVLQYQSFASQLSGFLGEHPNLAVASIVAADSSGYTVSYVVVMKPKS